MTYLEIPGWFDFEDAYDLLYDQVSDGGVVVEIGTYLGKSAVDEIFPNARKGGTSWWLYDLNLKVCKGNTA